jgi:hypothetical protein
MKRFGVLLVSAALGAALAIPAVIFLQISSELFACPKMPSREGLKFGGRRLRGAQPQLLSRVGAPDRRPRRDQEYREDGGGRVGAMLFDDGFDPIEDARAASSRNSGAPPPRAALDDAAPLPARFIARALVQTCRARTSWTDSTSRSSGVLNCALARSSR